MLSDLLELDVAKKTTRPTRRPKTESEVERKPMVLQMRGSAEWKAWLERLAAFDDRSAASLGERAIHRYALEIGFDEKPPER